MTELNTGIVFTPNFDLATSCARHWMYEAMIENKNKDFGVSWLDGDEARLKPLEDTLKLEDPINFYGSGHGTKRAFTGQELEIILTPRNAHLMEGRVCHLLSCFTAIELGPALIEYCLSYFGYTSEFIVGLTLDPRPSSVITQSLVEPDTEIERSLVEGLTTGEAYENSLRKSDYWIEYWRRSGVYYADLVIRSIIFNKEALRLLGREDVKITVRAPAIPALAILGLAGLSFAVAVRK